MADGQWRAVLESVNPAYAPLTLSGSSDDEFHWIAEFVDVIDDDDDDDLQMWSMARAPRRGASRPLAGP
jgi:hypothetical protein